MSGVGLLNTSHKNQNGGGGATISDLVNGLHLDGTLGKLGGELIEDTQIELDAFDITLIDNLAGPAGLIIENSSVAAAGAARLTLRNSQDNGISYIEQRSVAGGNDTFFKNADELIFGSNTLVETGRVLQAGGFAAPINKGYGFVNADGQSAPGMSSNGNNLQLRSKTNNTVSLMHGNIVMCQVIASGMIPAEFDGVVSAGQYAASEGFLNVTSGDLWLPLAYTAGVSVPNGYLEVVVNGFTLRLQAEQI